MLDEKAYKTLRKYAKKLSNKPEDIDDIFQEAIVKLLECPAKQEITNKFLFTVAKRAKYSLFYKPDGRPRFIGEMQICDEYDNSVNALSYDVDLDNVVLLSEFREKAFKTTLPEKEKELLKSIIYDTELEWKSNVISAHRHKLTIILKNAFGV